MQRTLPRTGVRIGSKNSDVSGRTLAMHVSHPLLLLTRHTSKIPERKYTNMGARGRQKQIRARRRAWQSDAPRRFSRDVTRSTPIITRDAPVQHTQPRALSVNAFLASAPHSFLLPHRARMSRPSTPGLFSSVLGYITREVSDFVVTAAGGEVKVRFFLFLFLLSQVVSGELMSDHRRMCRGIKM